MRSYPADYEMISPGTLQGVLRLLESEPGQWTPIAGATEVMVLFGAGKLAARQLVSSLGSCGTAGDSRGCGVDDAGRRVQLHSDSAAMR